MVILIYIYIYTHLKGTTGLACPHHRGATFQVSESSCKKNLVVIIIIIIIDSTRSDESENYDQSLQDKTDKSKKHRQRKSSYDKV